MGSSTTASGVGFVRGVRKVELIDSAREQVCEVAVVTGRTICSGC